MRGDVCDREQRADGDGEAEHGKQAAAEHA
jgi:hypothetical protein